MKDFQSFDKALKVFFRKNSTKIFEFNEISNISSSDARRKR